MPLVQERAKILAELPDLADFFFSGDLDYDSSLLRQAVTKQQPDRDAEPILRTTWEKLKELDVFDADSLEALLRPLAKELGLKTGELFSLLRVATTGRTAAPPLFQTMAVLGRERCLGRIETALHRLQRDGPG
jgi:glutamyl-tRNA synthetase